MTTPSSSQAAPDRPHVAIVLAIVGDLSGSGGTERLYSRLHEHLRDADGRVRTTFVTSRGGLRRFRAAGALQDATGVSTIEIDGAPGQSRLTTLIMTAKLLSITLHQRFDIVHLPSGSPVYLPYVAALRALPRGRRPRVAVTVVDCTLAHSLVQAPARGTYERQVLDAYHLYRRWARVDGLYSWYTKFVEVASAQWADRRNSVLRAARYCFTQPEHFTPHPHKDNVIVFAGRLSEQKRPLLFVDAIAELRRIEPGLLQGWRVEMYGKGVLQAAVEQRIASLDLGGVITLGHAIDLAPILARSRLFVSTQSLENFTSLAMLEALSTANAVVAEDVGQTREFVVAGENGVLATEPTPAAFAGAIAHYLRHPDRFDRMAAASRRLATEVHTIGHFSDDIVAFWRSVLGRSA